MKISVNSGRKTVCANCNDNAVDHSFQGLRGIITFTRYCPSCGAYEVIQAAPAGEFVSVCSVKGDK
jgi:hypothetical protein